MPADKAHRVQLRRAARNKPVRTQARTRVKKAREAIQSNPTAPETAEAVKNATSYLSRAAVKGVIHKNNASRRISRINQMYNKALAASQASS